MLNSKTEHLIKKKDANIFISVLLGAATRWEFLFTLSVS